VVDFSNPNLKNYDQVTMGMLKLLLKRDPNDRPSAQEALSHPYFKELQMTGKVTHTNIYNPKTMEDVPNEIEGSLASLMMNKPAMKGKLDTYKNSLASTSSKGNFSIMGSQKNKKDDNLYKMSMMKNAMKDNMSIDSYRSTDSKNSIKLPKETGKTDVKKSKFNQ
jgi:serine/threonine protein kinase